MFPKWAWSGSREQFLHCGLRKFRHSKSSVYRWYTQLDHRRFVYDIYKTMKSTRTRHAWVHLFITHRPTLTLQLHNFDLFRTCRTSSFCTVAWQLARFQLIRRITQSLSDSWASCFTFLVPAYPSCLGKEAVVVVVAVAVVVIGEFYWMTSLLCYANDDDVAARGCMHTTVQQRCLMAPCTCNITKGKCIKTAIDTWLK